MVLSPYALSGTDIAYGAVWCYLPTRPYAMSGTDMAYVAGEREGGGDEGGRRPRTAGRRRRRPYLPTRCSPISLRASYPISLRAAPLSPSAHPTRCPVLPRPMSGTAIAYGAIPLRASYAMSGTGIAYGAIFCRAYAMSAEEYTRIAEEYTRVYSSAAIACTRMSGVSYYTDTAYGAIFLRAPYAMSGTGIAYGADACAARCPDAKLPTLFAVLTSAMLVPGALGSARRRPIGGRPTQAPMVSGYGTEVWSEGASLDAWEDGVQ
eukprot:186339-Rhodomonas_salina.1